jgi:DNA-directed RNA polymerase specialized sigma24 family protein
MGESIQHVFDGYCKRVLQNAASDYFEALGRRKDREVLIDDYGGLPGTVDQYPCDIHVYRVFDTEVTITSYTVVEALNALPLDRRQIVLAACCVGLPDRIVADRMQLVRRTVTYRKAKALEEMRRRFLLV